MPEIIGEKINVVPMVEDITKNSVKLIELSFHEFWPRLKIFQKPIWALAHHVLVNIVIGKQTFKK